MKNIFRTILLLLVVLTLGACADLQRTMHMYSAKAPKAHTFHYQDGGSSLYYSFSKGDIAHPKTLVFFYGGSGCPSWKSVMPDYTKGLPLDAHIIVLNKRFVSDKATGLSCSLDFHKTNHPEQWVADYAEFIAAQLRGLVSLPTNVVLVGVSEGGLVAVRVARKIPEVTHLAIIGDGVLSMRESLKILAQKGVLSIDVDAGMKAIASDPRSLEKEWFGLPYRWWSDIIDVDLLPDFLALNMPIWVAMGEKDDSVPVESALQLAEKFKEAEKTNLVLRIYPNANHRLQANGVSHRTEFFQAFSHALK